MKALPTPVDDVVATLRNDVVATLSKRSADVLTMFQSCSFKNCLTASLQGSVILAQANTLLFLEKLPFWRQ